jgi:nicotinamidase-related amidase
MDFQQLMQASEPFLRYLVDWEASLPTMSLAEVAAAPERVAIISVDVINGFCTTGPLASPRIQGIVAPVADLLARAHALGVPHLALVQEGHEPDAVEFTQYPRHAVRGTEEAEAVPELKALPFYGRLARMTKNSIHPALGTALEAWLADRPGVDTFIGVGDCTDLCTYQLAMHLRLRANARQLAHRVIVPEVCTETFDLPVATAQQIGAVPHDGDLLHLIFLYSMRLNGVEVVRALT